MLQSIREGDAARSAVSPPNERHGGVCQPVVQSAAWLSGEPAQGEFRHVSDRCGPRRTGKPSACTQPMAASPAWAIPATVLDGATTPTTAPGQRERPAERGDAEPPAAPGRVANLAVF